MIRDIEISDDGIKVLFSKQMFNETEIILAKCFGFVVDLENKLIIATIAHTSKKAMYEFIAHAFKSFNESLAEKTRRDDFFEKLDLIYSQQFQYADQIVRSKIPYFDKFYEHQSSTLAETFWKQNIFLAFEMGLGKTLTSASISRIHQIRLTVIMCPAAVKWNWMADLIKFGFNQLYFTMLDASKSRTFRAFDERFIIINYDILDKYLPLLMDLDIGHFIFDEAQLLKNHLSARAKHVHKLVEHFPDSRKTFLSGTPIANRVNDIFNYLKIIGHELGNNHKKFLEQFTITASGRGGERVTGGKNLQDLHLKLSNFMIRKTKDDCLDLPDKIYLNYKFELDDYREEYNAIIKEMTEQKSLSSLTGNVHSLNIITAKAKKKGIIELAETIIDDGRKVVIFGGYKDPLNELAEYFGHRCVKIDGSVDSFMRNEHVKRFIADPDCTVFLGNWQAAGVGINLVNAADIIVQSFPLTPASLYQGLDRLHRIGQSKAVNVHYTFCEDSIDEHLHALILDKEGDINVVIDQGKELILRENMIEVLIKKLLKRDDIVFESPFRKANHEVPGEEIQEAQEEKLEESLLHGDRPDITRELRTDIPVSNDLPRHISVVKEVSVSGDRQLGNSHFITEEKIKQTIFTGDRVVSENIGRPEKRSVLGQRGHGDQALRRYYLVKNEKELVIMPGDKFFSSPGYENIFSDTDFEEVLKRGRHYQMTFAGHVDLSFPIPENLDIDPEPVAVIEIPNPLFKEEDFILKMTSRLMMIDQNEIVAEPQKAAVKAFVPPPGF